MKFKILTMLSIFIFYFMFIPTTALANSSWNWFTTSPMTVLPYAIVFTLLFETIGIIIFGNVHKYIKTFFIVSLSNLVSFILPYLVRAHIITPTSGENALIDAFISGPYYIVLFGYLFLTLVIELPLTYYLLEEDTLNKKRLKLSIIVVNIVTTLAVAVTERIICLGQW